jgi:hypothetical protein
MEGTCALCGLPFDLCPETQMSMLYRKMRLRSKVDPPPIPRVNPYSLDAWKDSQWSGVYGEDWGDDDAG